VVKDAEARFDDEAVKPAVPLAVRGAGFEVQDLEADLDPAAPPAAPGRIRAWCEAPGIAQRATLTGSVVAAPTAPQIALEAKREVGALGLRVKSEPRAATSTSASAGTSAKGNPPEWSESRGARIALGKLHVGELAVDLDDRSRPTAIELPVRMSADLGPLVFD